MILLSSHSPSVKSVAGNGDSPGGCREGEIPMEQFRKLSSVFLEINNPYMSCYAKKYKKWLAAPCFFFVAAVGASRNYLMVHYPTDVIAGFITGAIGATIALLVTNLIWKKLIDNQNKKFCAAFIDADIRSLFSKRICAKKEALNTEKNEEPDID